VTRGWGLLVAGPGLALVVVAVVWFAVTGLLAALVAWPALTGVGAVAVAAAKAATDPSRTNTGGT
jgi:hypothetical protein